MEKYKKNYDVIILGGGTSGCSCAWNCARLGLKTLLLEKNNFLGGAITSQLVIPAMKTDHKNFNTVFYEELCKNAKAKNAQITYIDGNPGWFNPLKLATILYDMLVEVGCDVVLNSKIDKIEDKTCYDTKYINKIFGKTKVLSLYVDTKDSNNINTNKYVATKHTDNTSCNKKTQIKKFNAKFFVDATGDANLCELLNAKFLPKENSQALSMRFIMDKVDKKAFSSWITNFDTNRNVTTTATIDGEIHFSTACTWDLNSNWALKPLFDKAVSEGVLKDTDRAYFQVFSIAGENDKVAFNCPRIMTNVELNPLNSKDVNEAKTIAQSAIKRIALFCNVYLKGFEQAKVFKIAHELGVRESRRVKGKYILTKEDIYKAKKFRKNVAYSNYPIDIHSIKRDNSVLEYVQKTYSIPLDSLIVDGFENLFVIGRCISADFYAQAAIRIQPTCFSMGEGLAKHLKLL